jgi:hypothetical protein
MAAAIPKQIATKQEELIEISQCTDFIHTIIEKAAEQQIYINWRHQTGLVLDRNQERAPVISSKVFTLICALGYLSTEYHHFVDRTVEFMRRNHLILQGIGVNTTHYHEPGIALHEFTEETLEFIYNDMERRQQELQDLIDIIDGAEGKY